MRLERERRLLLSWAKAGKDSKESREATRSEGDDLEESAARAGGGERRLLLSWAKAGMEADLADFFFTN